MIQADYFGSQGGLGGGVLRIYTHVSVESDYNRGQDCGH